MSRGSQWHIWPILHEKLLLALGSDQFPARLHQYFIPQDWWAMDNSGLVVGFNPSEKYEFVSWERLSHILWKNKKCLKAPIRYRWYSNGLSWHVSNTHRFRKKQQEICGSGNSASLASLNWLGVSSWDGHRHLIPERLIWEQGLLDGDLRPGMTWPSMASCFFWKAMQDPANLTSPLQAVSDLYRYV